MTQITFNTLALTNFAVHKSLTVEFGDITRINGRNGDGKSTIGEAITYVLHGTDTFGTKFDPTPITYTADTTRADLLITVDEKQLLLSRSIESGKNKFYVNEVPKKATEFTALVESICPKQMFLSLFTPGAFFTQHWEKQRVQLLSFVSEPTNAEVLSRLLLTPQQRLGEALKQHSLDDLDKMHRDVKLKLDKETDHKAGAIDAQQRQLEQAQTDLKEAAGDLDEEAILIRLQDIKGRVDAHMFDVHKTGEAIETKATLKANADNLAKQFYEERDRYLKLRDEPLEDTCNACGQHLQGEALKHAEAHRAEKVAAKGDEVKRLFDEQKAAKEAFNGLDLLGEVVAETPEGMDELVNEYNRLDRAARLFGNVTQTSEQLAQARADLDAMHKKRNTAVYMIEWIKDFRAKRAEIMAEKVAALFTNLSVRLYNEQANGDLKTTFEVEMHGKPYSVLSTAERIKAGLELIGALHELARGTAPVFVDNAESILQFEKPRGQLILARVMDTDFAIESENLKGADLNE